MGHYRWNDPAKGLADYLAGRAGEPSADVSAAITAAVGAEVLARDDADTNVRVDLEMRCQGLENLIGESNTQQNANWETVVETFVTPAITSTLAVLQPVRLVLGAYELVVDGAGALSTIPYVPG